MKVVTLKEQVLVLTVPASTEPVTIRVRAETWDRRTGLIVDAPPWVVADVNADPGRFAVPRRPRRDVLEDDAPPPRRGARP